MEDLTKYIDAIEKYINGTYTNNFREPATNLPYPYLVPGSTGYTHQLWDWDSWLTGYALMSIDDKSIEEHQKGCVLNFLGGMDNKGRIPVVISAKPIWFMPPLDDSYNGNIHKPCLAIHALEISERYNDYEWIRPCFDKVIQFMNAYDNLFKHEETGLYIFHDDLVMGFDNDPTAFYRPDDSTATIYLNSLMHEELKSVAKLAKALGREDDEKEFLKRAEALKTAIQNECYDEADGFFYSVDVSLRPIDPNQIIHSGHPRFWHSLPIKITTWATMLTLWSGIATKEQADRIVQRYLDPKGLYSPYGIRSVAKYERMFGNFDSGNPSCWIGPIWINANYFTYVGLKNYGYDELAKEIAIKTIKLLGEDVIKNGEFHEYYHSEEGYGIRGNGFQSWNFLVLKMIDDLKNNQ